MDFRRVLPEATIYVYDNNSTDGTAELAAKAGSRYLLVNLVARRARNIAAAAQAAGEPLDTKPVSMAIDEVYDGRLQVVHKE